MKKITIVATRLGADSYRATMYVDDVYVGHFEGPTEDAALGKLVKLSQFWLNINGVTILHENVP